MELKTSKRRELLSGAQRVQLLALPIGLRELEERYSFTPSDLEFIGAHRTNSNRLGIAVQLCFLRHPGWAWTPEEPIPGSMLRWIAAQVEADPGDIESYAKRDPTRREHFLELLQEYNWRSFGPGRCAPHDYRNRPISPAVEYRPQGLRRAFPQDRAGLSDGAWAHPKQFIYSEDGWAGGVYLWKTRAEAEAFYSGPWLAGIRERYGMDPQIKYFHTACVTDNSAEAVLLPDAE